MLRHVSALAVDHLQGAHTFFSMCKICFILYRRNYIYDYNCYENSISQLL